MVKIDHIDLKILDLLRGNARMTHTEIAREVGMSVPAVGDRFRRLENEGFLTGYLAMLNENLLDLNLMAFLFLTERKPIHHTTLHDQIKQLIRNIPEITEFHRITGEWTFLCRMFVRNTDHLSQVLDRLSDSSLFDRYMTCVRLVTLQEYGGVKGFRTS